MYRHLCHLLAAFFCAAALIRRPLNPPLCPQRRDRPTSLPDAPAPQTEAARKAQIHDQADEEVKREETQRILTVVPNFNTVISGRAALSEC